MPYHPLRETGKKPSLWAVSHCHCIEFFLGHGESCINPSARSVDARCFISKSLPCREDWRGYITGPTKSFSRDYEKATAAHVIPAPLCLHYVVKETNYFSDWL
jgi:hypothetical protein